MRKFLIVSIILVSNANFILGQTKSMDPIPPDKTWKQKIYQLAPDVATAPISKKHKVLLFSLFTGFDHWVIPHADAVINILSEKTGAYEVVKSLDISMFEKKNLKQFDAVVLNNNCSKGDRRDLFYDALIVNSEMSEEQKVKKSGRVGVEFIVFCEKRGWPCRIAWWNRNAK